jgi:hypothetical protein
MDNKIVVHKARTNAVQVNIGVDITGDTITSQVRTQPDLASPLIMTWVVEVVVAAVGELVLRVDNTVTAEITANSGYMDLKRMSDGEPIAVFKDPIEVEFQGSVTL